MKLEDDAFGTDVCTWCFS